METALNARTLVGMMFSPNGQPDTNTAASKDDNTQAAMVGYSFRF